MSCPTKNAASGDQKVDSLCRHDDDDNGPALAASTGCSCATTPEVPAKSTGDAEVDRLVLEWLRRDRCRVTRKQILDLVDKGNVMELESRLKKRLKFGTAGLRAAMGAGYSLINDLTVIQSTQGLLRYLRHMFGEDLLERGIVVGYDGRHNSTRFARRVAAIFLNARIRVRIFSEVVPTPWVPYAIAKYRACAGVMITASHNPKQDNGYKVYWANGSQIVHPHDRGITESIDSNLEPWSNSWDLEIATMKGSEKATHGSQADIAFRYRSDPFADVWSKYFSDMKAEIGFNPRQINKKAKRKIVHTSLHGVGHKFAREMFATLVLNKFLYVFNQYENDPDFPSVRTPNPEEGREILQMAMKTADDNDAVVVIATDPDADRMGVAEKGLDGWRILTGNEIASILAWWILRKKKSSEMGLEELAECFMLSSTVSSKILESMAKIEGFQFEETLPGTKWLGNRMAQLTEKGKKGLFAFEEAMGFMPTPRCCLEKDGISAAGMIGEILAYLEEEERLEEAAERANAAAAPPPPPPPAEGEGTVEEEEVPEEEEKIPWTFGGLLDKIYILYGCHLSTTSFFICHDPERIRSMFDRIRTMGPDGGYPIACGSYDILHVRDLTTGYDSSRPDLVAVLPASKSTQMISFFFANGCRASLRTSGTEPKVKYYVEAVGPPKPVPEEVEQAEANLNQLDVDEWNLPREKERLEAEMRGVAEAMVSEWFDL